MKDASTRRAVRHALVVDVEVSDLQSGVQIKEQTKDLSRYGCGVSTSRPFRSGTKVMLKVIHAGKEMTAFGKVIYGRPDIGMGIVFTTIGPEDQELLDDWFTD